MALAGIVGWFVLSPRYAVNNPEEIPVIRRPQTAIKVQPSEPGGMEILNQDKSVYDIVEKKPEDDTKVENLLPPPEQPKLPIIEPAPQAASVPNDMFEKAETVPVQDEAPKVIAEAQKIVAAKEEAEEKVVSIKEASQAAVVAPAKVDTVKIVKGEKVKVPQ